MNEFDINNIWNTDHQEAFDHYQSLSDIEKIAKKQSGNILYKIRRNMIIEFIITLIIAVAIGLAILNWDIMLFSGYVVIMVISVYISFREYYKCHIMIKHVNQKNITKAIKDYLDILKNYIRRTKIWVNYITPVAFITGIVLTVISQSPGENLTNLLLHIGLAVLTGIPFLILIIWFANKKYINWVYGRQYENLKSILQRLESYENGS
ncbi:MAG: hypothetical protein K9H84_00525 [Bacteroidales bacterium]|nr:hypothetical protein [Bacteroidales bacterium]